MQRSRRVGFISCNAGVSHISSQYPWHAIFDILFDVCGSKCLCVFLECLSVYVREMCALCGECHVVHVYCICISLCIVCACIMSIFSVCVCVCERESMRLCV